MTGARTHPRLPAHLSIGGVPSAVASILRSIQREMGMPLYEPPTELRRFGFGKSHKELAQFIEGHINRVASGRIRDLHVVYSDDKIILQGRSRTYHAKQLAHQAVLDLTDGFPLLANQIVVS
jgi:hypothetical protein